MVLMNIVVLEKQAKDVVLKSVGTPGRRKSECQRREEQHTNLYYRSPSGDFQKKDDQTMSAVRKHFVLRRTYGVPLVCQSGTNLDVTSLRSSMSGATRGTLAMTGQMDITACPFQ